MRAHTKGPWTLTHVGGKNFAVQAFEIRGMFGDKPNVYPIFNKDTTAINGATIYAMPEDARLIAAGPGLSAVADAVVELFGDEPDSTLTAGERRLRDMARAASAKVRGES